MQDFQALGKGVRNDLEAQSGRTPSGGSLASYVTGGPIHVVVRPGRRTKATIQDWARHRASLEPSCHGDAVPDLGGQRA